MSKREQKTPDWALMIEQLQANNLTLRKIGEAMSLEMTARMLLHYRHGAQPPHWRGEGLIALWCSTTGKTRQDLPMMMLIRGHRAQTRAQAQPAAVSLPQWPPVAPVSVKPIKRGRSRKVVGVA